MAEPYRITVLSPNGLAVGIDADLDTVNITEMGEIVNDLRLELHRQTEKGYARKR